MTDGRPVYSTEGGDLRTRGERRLPERPSPRPGIPIDGVVRVGHERAGRKGKGVTTVHGLPGGPEGWKAAAADLKRLCGSGGAVKDGVVEIQGDHRPRVAEHLRARGHTVKLMGG